MGIETEKIIYKPKATNSIKAISQYISEKGYQETSEKFAERLYTFGDSLLIFPGKYPLCRFLKLAKRMLHCAVFEQNYIFIYKVIQSRLVVYNIVNTKAMK